ncbi:MAG: hypothetical protein FWD21_02425 [Peptococcaceae bacterium]|nr:hypothetical protein [Peptococcaceae bacterium]
MSRLRSSRFNFVEWLPFIIFVLIFAVFMSGVQSTAKSQDEESLRAVEESIARAVLCCYSIEGRYPDTFEYLKENYHLSINEDRYVVFYQIFASNIMPDIDVIESRGVR